MTSTAQSPAPLDVVGDRWTLLIVRELLLGPRRFTDLADGLPGVATSVLTDPLKQLDDEGLVVKRTLPPPPASRPCAGRHERATR